MEAEFHLFFQVLIKRFQLVCFFANVPFDLFDVFHRLGSTQMQRYSPCPGVLYPCQQRILLCSTNRSTRSLQSALIELDLILDRLNVLKILRSSLGKLLLLHAQVGFVELLELSYLIAKGKE